MIISYLRAHRMRFSATEWNSEKKHEKKKKIVESPLWLNFSNQLLYTVNLPGGQARGRVGFPECLCQTQMGSSEELAQKPRVSPGQVYISNPSSNISNIFNWLDTLEPTRHKKLEETTAFWGFFWFYFNRSWIESFKCGHICQQWLSLSWSPPVFLWGAVDSELFSKTRLKSQSGFPSWLFPFTKTPKHFSLWPSSVRHKQNENSKRFLDCCNLAQRNITTTECAWWIHLGLVPLKHELQEIIIPASHSFIKNFLKFSFYRERGSCAEQMATILGALCTTNGCSTRHLDRIYFGFYFIFMITLNWLQLALQFGKVHWKARIHYSLKDICASNTNKFCRSSGFCVMQPCQAPAKKSCLRLISTWVSLSGCFFCK